MMLGMERRERRVIWALLAAVAAVPAAVYGLQMVFSQRPTHGTPVTGASAPTQVPEQWTDGFPAAMTYWEACYLEASVCSPGDSNLPNPQARLPSFLLQPLRLPALSAGAACPSSSASEVSTSAFGGSELGTGPVRLLSSPTVSFTPAGSLPGWYSEDESPLWFSVPAYQGAWVVRGRQLDGTSPLLFGDPPNVTTSLVVPPVPTLNTYAGYRTVPMGFLVRGPGCYGAQVDGSGFSYDIVFRAVVAPGPQSDSCASGELQLGGSLNACAVVASNGSQSCSVSGTSLNDVITLRGGGDEYLLYVSIDGGYNGPRAYYLSPWAAGTLDAQDGQAKVAIREYRTGAFWQSVSGTLEVTGNDGNSGSLAVNLTFVGGESPPPADGALGIIGNWTCA
jgi:hypothetical protein